MQNKNDDLGYPAEWGTENFPHPNPYLPPIPRPLPGLGVLLSLAIFPGIPVGLGYLFTVIDVSSGIRVILFLTTFLVGGVFCFLNLANRGQSARYWRKGKIVPAVVTQAARGPDPEGKNAVVSLMMPRYTSALLQLLPENTQNYATVQFVLDGIERTEKVKMGRLWNHCRDGSYLWLLEINNSAVNALSLHAPRSFHNFKPPHEAENWLQHAMPHGHDLCSPSEPTLSYEEEQAQLEEHKQAAKANAQTEQKGSKYE